MPSKNLFKINVSNMVSSSGNTVPNQFEIYGRDNNGKSFRIFQSYSTTIAKIYEEYPNDRVRWNDYFHDIEKLVKVLDGDK